MHNGDERNSRAGCLGVWLGVLLGLGYLLWVALVVQELTRAEKEARDRHRMQLQGQER